MENVEELRLPCPLCQSDHSYKVIVERSLIVAHMTGDMDLRPRRREFVRLFMCPTKTEQFQATVKLSETIMDPIRAVTVGEAQQSESD
jgi:hypothetical protein